MSTITPHALGRHFDEHWDEFFSSWKTFLKFQSVSTDPAFDEACTSCADWLVAYLSGLGFSARKIETSGKPLVYAERAGDAGAPTVLFYGHYDVQPVDPLNLWETPPFEPTLRNGRVYARGAQDNKGQVFYVLKAIEHLIACGSLKSGLKIIIEGEEECGSGGLRVALPELRELIQADLLMVCDTGTCDVSIGTITMGLRGIIGIEAKLYGPNYDLHSGVHGGVVRNPAVEIARLVATLHTRDGAVAVEGFYDGVTEPTDEERRLANCFPLTAEQYQAQVGVEPIGGEAGWTPAERRGLRPTIEVNGIYGGYMGEGGKTIIPSSAGVKLSARLVKGQDPARCLKLIKDHLAKHVPPGVRLEFGHQELGGRAVALRPDAPAARGASEVLKEICSGGVLFMWEGASVPIVAELAEVSGAEPLLVGFGVEADLIHAPNESFSIAQLRTGFQYAAMMLARVGAV